MSHCVPVILAGADDTVDYLSMSTPSSLSIGLYLVLLSFSLVLSRVRSHTTLSDVQRSVFSEQCSVLLNQQFSVYFSSTSKRNNAWRTRKFSASGSWSSTKDCLVHPTLLLALRRDRDHMARLQLLTAVSNIVYSHMQTKTEFCGISNRCDDIYIFFLTVVLCP